MSKAHEGAEGKLRALELAIASQARRVVEEDHSEDSRDDLQDLCQSYLEEMFGPSDLQLAARTAARQERADRIQDLRNRVEQLAGRVSLDLYNQVGTLTNDIVQDLQEAGEWVPEHEKMGWQPSPGVVHVFKQIAQGQAAWSVRGQKPVDPELAGMPIDAADAQLAREQKP